MRPISIYIHIPFCVKKCNYCDFLSAPATRGVQEAYLHALKGEIAAEAKKYAAFRVNTVFVGGGTPTAVDAGLLCGVLESVRENYFLEEDAEITVEANPGTVTDKALTAYRAQGVNRLSIGLQSARDEELKLLGRIHTYKDFERTYQLARRCGFRNVNVDIMSALPGQKEEDCEETLRRVLSLEPPPEHISAYSLILEEGTPFFERYGAERDELERTGRPQAHLPSEEAQRAMYGMTKGLLARAGYRQYEISNYCLSGHRCRHNTVYWRRGDYVGFGLGAASMVDNVRFENTRVLSEYLSRADKTAERRRLSVEEQMEEYMFLGLRMMEGVSEEAFRETFGVPVAKVYEDAISKSMEEGLLSRRDGQIALTGEGVYVSNRVMARFLLA